MNFITGLMFVNSVQSGHCACYQLMFVPHTCARFSVLFQMLHIWYGLDFIHEYMCVYTVHFS